jgi:hypothetical protein
MLILAATEHNTTQTFNSSQSCLDLEEDTADVVAAMPMVMLVAAATRIILVAAEECTIPIPIPIHTIPNNNRTPAIHPNNNNNIGINNINSNSSIPPTTLSECGNQPLQDKER